MQNFADANDWLYFLRVKRGILKNNKQRVRHCSDRWIERLPVINEIFIKKRWNYRSYISAWK